ncbi:MAG: hypothetical protein ACLTC3_11495 [Evtepia gabavorous]
MQTSMFISDFPLFLICFILAWPAALSPVKPQNHRMTIPVSTGKNSKPLCQINADPKSPPVADVSPEEYKFTPFQYITVCIITKVFSNYKPGKYRIKKNFFLLLPGIWLFRLNMTGELCREPVLLPGSPNFFHFQRYSPKNLS